MPVGFYRCDREVIRISIALRLRGSERCDNVADHNVALEVAAGCE